jgi:hypothetical protein
MKSYVCKKINYDFIIDGDLSKSEWQNVESIFLSENKQGGEPIQSTEVKAIWGDEYLYFAFTCQDNFIYATMNKFNDSIWKEEAVEVFIGSGEGDDNLYFEFNFNPLNAHLHYFVVPNKGRDPLEQVYARNKDTTVSTVIVDKEKNIWQVEAAINFRELFNMKNKPPKDGDKVRINFFRIDIVDIVKEENEYSAWSPTFEGNFHVPDAFGEMIFEE